MSAGRMAISTLFGSGSAGVQVAPQNQQPQQQAQPQQQQQPAGMQVPPQKFPTSPEPSFQGNNGTDPKEQTPTEAASPLDEFKDLFTIDSTGEEAETEDPDAPFFATDPAKLQDFVSRQRFTDPEEMAELAHKAVSGDSAALTTLLNQVAQKTFAQAIEFNTTVANRTAKTAVERARKELPSKVKDLLSHDTLSSMNPAFSHPSMQPMVNALRQQMQTKYPTATPAQVAQLTNKYLTQMSATLTAANSQQTTPTAEQGPDWSDFFS